MAEQLNYRYEGSMQRGEQVAVKRPWGVTVISCFQAFKSIILLTAGILLHVSPTAVTNSRSVLYPLLYLAMRGNAGAVDAAMGGDKLLAGILSGVIFALGVYVGAIGIGLWQVKEWARRSVMLTCFMTFLLYAKSTFFPSEAAARSNLGSTPSMTNFYILLGLDVIVAVYFLRSNIAELFLSNRADSYEKYN